MLRTKICIFLCMLIDQNRRSNTCSRDPLEIYVKFSQLFDPDKLLMQYVQTFCNSFLNALLLYAEQGNTLSDLIKGFTRNSPILKSVAYYLSFLQAEYFRTWSDQHIYISYYLFMKDVALYAESESCFALIKGLIKNSKGCGVCSLLDIFRPNLINT